MVAVAVEEGGASHLDPPMNRGCDPHPLGMLQGWNSASYHSRAGSAQAAHYKRGDGRCDDRAASGS